MQFIHTPTKVINPHIGSSPSYCVHNIALKRNSVDYQHWKHGIHHTVRPVLPPGVYRPL